MTEKIRIITHSEDIDGAMCAILAKFINKDDTVVDAICFSSASNKDETILSEFNKWCSDIYEDDERENNFYRFIISDLDSHSAQIVLLLRKIESMWVDEKIKTKLTIIDHHQESRRLLHSLIDDFGIKEENLSHLIDVVTPNTYENFESEDDQSAASTFLMWMTTEKYLNLNLVPAERLETIRHMTSWISRYDTWSWKKNPGYILEEISQPVELYFHTLFGILGLESFIFTFANILSTTNQIDDDLFKDDLINLVNIDTRKRERFIEFKKKQLIRASFSEYTVGLVIADENNEYISMMGNKICEENPDIDFVMILFPSSSGFSLRSTKTDLNCARIAKFLAQGNGGGHPQASGGTLTSERMIEFLTVYLTEREKKNKEAANKEKEKAN